LVRSWKLATLLNDIKTNIIISSGRTGAVGGISEKGMDGIESFCGGLS
jgi:hypothetical protein